MDNISDSKTLKGFYKHALRVEALRTKAFVAELGWRLTNPKKESVKLRMANRWLRRRVDNCEAEVKWLREKVEAFRKGVTPLPLSPSSAGQSPSLKIPKRHDTPEKMEVVAEVHNPPPSPIAPVPPTREETEVGEEALRLGRRVGGCDEEGLLTRIEALIDAKLTVLEERLRPSIRTATVDRGARCYRCGGTDHRAS
ncbi:nadh-dependent butanol dehydrogenase [Lasius niger]|uniref:Nadh-dependent butanol dehydrogenase n=1 Tax=Lasius niger TaxID=67767 RepID=A0A0J7KBY8_LASNI|nr:nadh-dependent butanol dehydrogenase [Lasius niger]